MDGDNVVIGAGGLRRERIPPVTPPVMRREYEKPFVGSSQCTAVRA